MSQPIRITPEFKARAQERFAELRELGPVHRVLLGSGLEAWTVVTYPEAREALTHPLLLKDSTPAEAALDKAGFAHHRAGSGLGGNMLSADPPEHTRLRKLVAAAFSPRRTQSLGPRIQEIADHLLDDMAPRGEVDLVQAYTAPLPVTVISELLGVPESERSDFRDWATAVLAPASAEQRAAMKEFNQYLAGLVDRKQAEPADDLLSDMISVYGEQDGRLSRDELIGTANLLVIAGHDTTVNLIGNTVIGLFRQPDQADLLRERPELLPGAVEEFLRYDPPLEQSTFRYAADDLELGGTRIAKGDIVVIALGSASRDAPQTDGGPNDVLDVARAQARHVAFGHGIHHCLGAPLARLEAATAIGSLLNRFPDLAPAAPLDDLPWVPTGMMRGPRSLPVKFTPTA